MNEYQKQCQWLSERYAEAAETGRKFQFDYGSAGWGVVNDGPRPSSDFKCWRLEPVKPRVGKIASCTPAVVAAFSDTAPGDGYLAIELTEEVKQALKDAGVCYE